MHHLENGETGERCEITDDALENFLLLCADQIKAAAEEAFEEIDDLSGEILNAARQSDAVLAAVENQSVGSDSVQQQIKRSTQDLDQSMRNASMRLQFADRLRQRLANVSENMVSMATLMQSINLPITNYEWSACLDATRANFTMEQEREMFDIAFGLNSTASTKADAQLKSGEPIVPILF